MAAVNLSKQRMFLSTMGAGAVAETLCYPVDSVKVWTQVASCKQGAKLPLWQLVRKGLTKGGGARCLFQGVHLSVVRNALSAGAVVGMQGPAGVKVGKLAMAVGAGPVLTKVVVSWGLSVAANAFLVPLETIKTRMQADARRPLHARRYLSSVHGFSAFVSKHGVLPLWRGSYFTFARTALWWTASIPVYSEGKRLVAPYTGGMDSTYTHLAASLGSGFTGTFFSQPADVLKTAIQNKSSTSKLGTTVVAKSMTQSVRRHIEKEGVQGLWRGFLPRYMRLGPWQLIFFCVYEKLLAADADSLGGLFA